MTAHPQQIGGYRIIDVLGRGGMGVVHRASDADGADLAIKTVRVATVSTLASIRREIQTLRELRHPGRTAQRRALRALQRGLALAEQFEMPYDRAVAHAGLARVAGGDHAEAARLLFQQLGCRWHLAHGLE